MKKVCTACQTVFSCTPENIEHCQCNAVSLDSSTLQELRATYADCLCISCLQKLAKSSKTDTFETNNSSTNQDTISYDHPR